VVKWLEQQDIVCKPLGVQQVMVCKPLVQQDMECKPLVQQEDLACKLLEELDKTINLSSSSANSIRCNKTNLETQEFYQTISTESNKTLTARNTGTKKVFSFKTGRNTSTERMDNFISIFTRRKQLKCLSIRPIFMRRSLMGIKNLRMI
jgi:hypothetical protein